MEAYDTWSGLSRQVRPPWATPISTPSQALIGDEPVTSLYVTDNPMEGISIVMSIGSMSTVISYLRQEETTQLSA